MRSKIFWVERHVHVAFRAQWTHFVLVFQKKSWMIDYSQKMYWGRMFLKSTIEVFSVSFARYNSKQTLLFGRALTRHFKNKTCGDWILMTRTARSCFKQTGKNTHTIYFSGFWLFCLNLCSDTAVLSGIKLVAGIHECMSVFFMEPAWQVRSIDLSLRALYSFMILSH